MAFDPLALQNTVYPKPVEASLLDRDDPIALPGTLLRLALKLGELR
jgi:hypothetical protein